jgi:glucose/arabinose dehydrogenase
VRRPGLAAVLLLLWLAPAPAVAQLRSQPFVSGLSSPLGIVQDPTDPSVQFVVQQAGRIRVVQNGVLGGDFLDITSSVLCCGERGLLGLAFPPDAATSGRFYVSFTRRPDGASVVARFVRSTPLVADPGSRVDLVWPDGNAFIAQPFSNHNGGHIAFGPDGYLYFALGDGGSGNDPGHRAQNPATLLGKILRLDVGVADDHPRAYAVPPTNPFVSAGPAGTLPEIWSFGWRNPWRFSFDDVALGGTGALVAGDVGQGAWEEIDYEPRGRGGRNYGWRNREGRHATPGVPASPGPAYTPLTEPIHEYAHGDGASVTGGYVYRGRLLGPAFVGRYFFADFIQGRVWSLALTVNGTTGEATASDVREHTAALGGVGNVSSLGVDAEGELFLVNYSGSIVRILGVPAPSAPTNLRVVPR